MLLDAGVSVDAVASDVDESALACEDPVRLAVGLAAQKAEAVAARMPDRWVLGADQVLADEGGIFGKPASEADQRARLLSMRGRSHRLITGWALRGPGAPVDAHAVTTMHMRADVELAEIDAYVATREGLYCAGGYAAEGLGGFLFSKVDGDWYNVIGLPLFDVIGALRERGWRFEGRS